MEIRKNLCGLTCSQFEQLARDEGQKSYTGRQIYKWIYKYRQFDFAGMTDLKKNLRSSLESRYRVELPAIADRQKSSDGTIKFLIGFEDGEAVEAVLIPDEALGRNTLCISSQVGCPLNCAFCATGKMGFRRNLTVGEIVGQVMKIRQEYGEEAFDNLVLMGMGEPLLNIDNVLAALDIMTDSLALMLGAKRITISTAGIVPGIKKLTDSGSKANLAISLNAPDDRLRQELMPITRKYPLDSLMTAVKEWTALYKRRVTFEYILFKNVNDSEEQALSLAKLVRGIPCKINLLAYNPVAGSALERPDEKTVEDFAQILYPRTPAVTVRKSRGSDIAAACGQLAGREGYQCKSSV